MTKHILLAMILIMAIGTAPAGNKCKIKKKDDGLMQGKSALIVMEASRRIDIWFGKGDEGDYRLYVHYLRDWSRPIQVTEDTPLKFELENGGEVAVSPDLFQESKHGGIPLMLNSKRIRASYTITEDQVKQLAASDIVGVEIHYISEEDGPEMEPHEVKPKRREDPRLRAQCILDHPS